MTIKKNGFIQMESKLKEKNVKNADLLILLDNIYRLIFIISEIIFYGLIMILYFLSFIFFYCYDKFRACLSLLFMLLAFLLFIFFYLKSRKIYTGDK